MLPLSIVKIIRCGGRELYLKIILRTNKGFSSYIGIENPLFVTAVIINDERSK